MIPHITYFTLTQVAAILTIEFEEQTKDKKDKKRVPDRRGPGGKHIPPPASVPLRPLLGTSPIDRQSVLYHMSLLDGFSRTRTGEWRVAVVTFTQPLLFYSFSSIQAKMLPSLSLNLTANALQASLNG